MTNSYDSTKLTPWEYKIMREGWTETPYSGQYYKHFDDGSYCCKLCNAKLFDSDTKYHSDTWWLQGRPSFDDAIPWAIEFRQDNSWWMSRTEIICSTCKSHLGHIFPDPDAKTWQHYCVNSTCLNFISQK